MKSLVAILLSLLMFASFMASNNLLPILKKQNDFTELSKEVKVENDAEKEAEKDNAKKDWLASLDFFTMQALCNSIKTEFAHYHPDLLFVVNDIEVRPPKC